MNVSRCVPTINFQLVHTPMTTLACPHLWLHDILHLWVWIFKDIGMGEVLQLLWMTALNDVSSLTNITESSMWVWILQVPPVSSLSVTIIPGEGVELQGQQVVCIIHSAQLWPRSARLAEGLQVVSHNAPSNMDFTKRAIISRSEMWCLTFPLLHHDLEQVHPAVHSRTLRHLLADCWTCGHLRRSLQENDHWWTLLIVCFRVEERHSWICPTHNTNWCESARPHYSTHKDTGSALDTQCTDSTRPHTTHLWVHKVCSQFTQNGGSRCSLFLLPFVQAKLIISQDLVSTRQGKCASWWVADSSVTSPISLTWWRH